MKKLGTLYGADVMIDTDSEEVVLCATKWLETMDTRFRKPDEEEFHPTY